MPRTARVAPGDVVQHVLNRGNGGMRLFHKPGDYQAFIRLLIEAQKRHAGVRLLAWSLMPNHWHMVLWPERDGELSAFMRWLGNSHVRRWHAHRQTVGGGHIYQERFKNFPIEADGHLLTVLRYVEANALRAKLVRQAEAWRWCSLWIGMDGERPALTEWPVERPVEWMEMVNEEMPEATLERLRQSVIRGRPYGSEGWVKRVAGLWGLQSTMRERGRLRKKRGRSPFPDAM